MQDVRQSALEMVPGMRVQDGFGGLTMDILKVFFPVLMVIGALGSLVVNIADHGSYATSLQWIGAGLLYTALTLRNMG